MTKKENMKTSGLRISRTTLPDKSQFSISKNVEDENFLKLLQQDSRELTIVLSLDGRIKYVNESIKTLLGFQAFRLLGTNIQRILPVQQWVAFRAAMRASEEEADQSIVIDCQFIDANNRKQSFSVSVKDQRHHPLVEGFVVHAKNINRLKKQEEKLKLRNLAIELIQEAVVIVKAKHPSIAYANQAFFELSGFTKTEIFGGKLNLFKTPYNKMLFADETDPKQIEKFQRALNSNRKFEGRIFSKKKNGVVFYNRFSLIPVLDEEGKVTQYIASMKEIKRRKA